MFNATLAYSVPDRTTEAYEALDKSIVAALFMEVQEEGQIMLDMLVRVAKGELSREQIGDFVHSNFAPLS